MWFHNLFDSLKTGRSHTPIQKARRDALRRRPVPCRLAVEALEGRSVPASLAVSDVTIMEGVSGIQNAVVSVTLDAASTKTVTVNYRTADGTARAGSDYNAVSGKLTFAPGQISKSVLIPVRGDRLSESDETFFVKLSGAKGATIADGRGVVTIVNDDPTQPPIASLSVGDVTITEGAASGTQNAAVTVSLSAPVTETVWVNYNTADGTALAGGDYDAVSGQLILAPGETSKTILVPVRGDGVAESSESFFVNLLTGAQNVKIADALGIVTIVDDDPRLPSISINDAFLWEGNSGTSLMTFTVSLADANGQAVTVNYATHDGYSENYLTVAIAGQDYLATSGTLTFAPGETTKTITVEIIGDPYSEFNEMFFVYLSDASANALIIDGEGIGWIEDDLGYGTTENPYGYDGYW